MNKHIFSLKGTKTLSWHRACYVEKSGMGGLKMDVNLPPLRVFTDAVKCNPGTLPDFTPNNLYHYVINNWTRSEALQIKSLDAYQNFVSG